MILKYAKQEMSSSKSSETFWIKSAEKLHARLAHTMICQQMMGLSKKEEMPKGRRKLYADVVDGRDVIFLSSLLAMIHIDCIRPHRDCSLQLLLNKLILADFKLLKLFCLESTTS